MLFGDRIKRGKGGHRSVSSMSQGLTFVWGVVSTFVWQRLGLCSIHEVRCFHSVVHVQTLNFCIGGGMLSIWRILSPPSSGMWFGLEIAFYLLHLQPQQITIT
jgi:hypothetical protein